MLPEHEGGVMGWWKIDTVESGGIDLQLGLNRGYGLNNAMPGVDSVEHHYNGNGPADACGVWMDEVSEALRKIGIMPRRTLLQSLWLDGPVADLPYYHRVVLDRGTKHARDAVENMYRSAWNRPPYEEELLAVFNFVANQHFRGGE
jgi:hypothetical protein